eukprot:CAMPEP_0197237820 /NCGR_PEP_ID=MMETSP1429-20130617/4550_1 /TAXON_ID=49237 /ORGANISM="Chaetoceros  sp., Strain UNC1202" /LENGTH=358 /DNA_ID=CAMNT_0042696897 /DNA_START=14 /DNA_END=1090 /DNA_ORIENTATION=+
MGDNNDNTDDMTTEQRLNYLRERGIQVETAEDRRRQQIKNIMNEPDEVDGIEYDDLQFVLIPHDECLPLKQLSMKVPKISTKGPSAGDLLLEELKPFFKAPSGQNVDMDLLKGQGTKSFASADITKISEMTMNMVAREGHIETFPMVHPIESNKYTSVNVYLDEVGLLKRLPMNKRAADFAVKAGFDPPPKFYGDVFLGRMKNKPVLKNVDFKLDEDTNPNATWLQNAVLENLEHQTAMDKITGKKNVSNNPNAGEEGISKEEAGYSWTQTTEEVELVIPLTSEKLTSKEVKANKLKVQYFTKKVIVEYDGKELLKLALYATVDVDGCTWTLDSSDKGTSVVVTCEKMKGVSWPRINL